MKTLAALMALAAALALAACGSGGGEGTAGSTAAAERPPARQPTQEGAGRPQGDSRPAGAGKESGSGRQVGGPPRDTSRSFVPPAHHDSAQGAAQFEAKGGDNSIEEFGAEAHESEFAAAAAALHGYMDSRAAGAWRDACSYMAHGFGASLAQLSGEAGGGNCPTALAALSAGIPRASLRDAAQADVASLRSEGDGGFLLFRGARGVAYFIPMTKEGSAWKVAALAPSTLP